MTAVRRSARRDYEGKVGTSEAGADHALPAGLPNIVIIGAMKCGTSSLHQYLDLHPSVSMSKVKEPGFFIEERTWPKGVAWYAAQFDASAQVRGESTTSYTSAESFPGVPARMAKVIPDARLIYVVRDPIERLVSHYFHNLNRGREARTLTEMVRDLRHRERSSYLERSMYWRQIREFLEYFPASRILVIESADLRERREATMRRVFDFVGVDPDFHSPLFRLEYHRSALKRGKTSAGSRLASSRLGRWMDELPQPWRRYIRYLVYLPVSRRFERPILSESDRVELRDQLREDADRFRAWTGHAFPGWSV